MPHYFGKDIQQDSSGNVPIHVRIWKHRIPDRHTNHFVFAKEILQELTFTLAEHRQIQYTVAIIFAVQPISPIGFR